MSDKQGQPDPFARNEAEEALEDAAVERRAAELLARQRLEAIGSLRARVPRSEVAESEHAFAMEVLIAMARAVPAVNDTLGVATVREVPIEDGHAPEQVFQLLFLDLMEVDRERQRDTPPAERPSHLRDAVDRLAPRFAADFRRLGRRGVLGFEFFTRLSLLIEPLDVQSVEESTPARERAGRAGRNRMEALKKEIARVRGGVWVQSEGCRSEAPVGGQQQELTPAQEPTATGPQTEVGLRAVQSSDSTPLDVSQHLHSESPRSDAEMRTLSESAKVHLQAFLTPRDLFAAAGVASTSFESFRKSLERWRLRNAGSTLWHEVLDRRPNQPRFLYRFDVIKQLDTGSKLSCEASSGRPAERKSAP